MAATEVSEAKAGGGDRWTVGMIIASNQGRRNFIFFEISVTVELGVLLNL